VKTDSWHFVFRTVLPVFLFLLPFFLPPFHYDFNYGALLLVTPIAFAVLTGFFIATATANYLNLQTLVAEEDAALITIYNLAKLVDPERAEKVAEAIDQYLMKAFDFQFTDYTEWTVQEFDPIIASVDAIRPESATAVQAAVLPYLHEVKSGLFKTRQVIALTAPRIVAASHWFVLGTLAAANIVLLFGLRNGSLMLNLILGLTSVAMYLILVILYEIDGDAFQEENLAYLNSQKVFHAIGRLSYFPEMAIKQGRVKQKNLPARYRVGIYKNFPHSLEKEVQVVERGA
jgi:hypothetical protein